MHLRALDSEKLLVKVELKMLLKGFLYEALKRDSHRN